MNFRDRDVCVQTKRNKKRATTTRVERSKAATFGPTSESLRVAASTAGSLRNFRPIAVAGDARAGSHAQEIPRAPTPVPGQHGTGFAPAHPVTAGPGLRLCHERQPAPTAAASALDFT